MQRGRPLPPRDDPLEDGPFNAIIFDYRGVGVSKPSLDCHGIHDRFTEAITTPVLETLKPSRVALEVCRDRLGRDGIALELFDSAQTARDIGAVHRALRFDEITLFRRLLRVPPRR